MRLPACKHTFKLVFLATQTHYIPLLLLFPFCLRGSVGPSELGDIVAAAVFSRS